MPRLKKRYVVNFPAHLADCEFNYRRLRRLMPGWQVGGGNFSNNKEEPADKDPGESGEKADINSDSSNKWRYIVGHNKSSEMALVLDVTDSAKYTTTVHIVVHPRLQNQMSWSKYLQYDAKKQQPIAIKPQISMADLQGSVTMLSNKFKSYSFEVRLYHDATVAEVIAWEGHRRFHARNEYPNPKMHQADEKAQLNRFLGELLELCLAQGRILDDVAITIN